jgi:hypothetical protein
MKLKSYDHWSRTKLLREFNGPMGQPDPAGVSEPVLAPGMAGPAEPRMGTRPGMSAQSPEFDQIYAAFLHALKGKPPLEQADIIGHLEAELNLHAS